MRSGFLLSVVISSWMASISLASLVRYWQRRSSCCSAIARRRDRLCMQLMTDGSAFACPDHRRQVLHSWVSTEMCYNCNNCHSNVQFQKFCSFTWDIKCHYFLTQYNKCQSLIYSWRRETAGMCEGRMLLYQSCFFQNKNTQMQVWNIHISCPAFYVQSCCLNMTWRFSRWRRYGDSAQAEPDRQHD